MPTDDAVLDRDARWRVLGELMSDLLRDMNTTLNTRYTDAVRPDDLAEAVALGNAEVVRRLVAEYLRQEAVITATLARGERYGR